MPSEQTRPPTPRAAMIPRLLLALVVAIAALLVWAALLPAPPGAAPAPHPEHASLLAAGAVPTPGRIALGWALGLAQIAFFGACFALGLQRGGRLGPIAWPLGWGLLGYAAVWTALVVSYATTAGDPEAALWGGFPAPTAWMLYGLWPFPLFFAWLYLRHFDGWFLNAEDLARFRARVAELERRGGPDDAPGPPIA